jgi:hypothetical protein
MKRIPILNNFKFIYGEPKTEKSDFLEDYNEILGFKVFKVSINDKAYVVFDKENNQYYNFERTSESIESIDDDLVKIIEVFVIKSK